MANVQGSTCSLVQPRRGGRGRRVPAVGRRQAPPQHRRQERSGAVVSAQGSRPRGYGFKSSLRAVEARRPQKNQMCSGHFHISLGRLSARSERMRVAAKPGLDTHEFGRFALRSGRGFHIEQRTVIFIDFDGSQGTPAKTNVLVFVVKKWSSGNEGDPTSIVLSP